jgi:hypothetical protein
MISGTRHRYIIFESVADPIKLVFFTNEELNRFSLLS